MRIPVKEYIYLDGTRVQVPDDTCRGCYLENHHDNIPEIYPIWENKDFTVRQDVEFPIPGFYIVSARQHINTIADLSTSQVAALGMIVHRVRLAMRETLGIARVHIILEERRINPHLHLWLLPLWENVMKRNDIDPKIYNSNIAEYLHLFNYDESGETVRRMNYIMRESLSQDMELKPLL